MTAPTVWDAQPARIDGTTGYAVVAPEDDPRKDLAAIHRVSGDASLLNRVNSRLAPVARWCWPASTRPT